LKQNRKEFLNFTSKNIEFQVLNGLPDMCFIISEDCLLINANKSAVAKLHLGHKDKNSFNFFDLFPSSYAQNIKSEFKKSIEKMVSSQIESQFINHSGSPIDCSVCFSPYTDSDGKKLCFVLAKDITDVKKKELELLRFFYVAQNTVNPLQLTDTSGKMIYVNPAFEKASGYKSDELIGNFPSIFSSGKHSKKFWKKMWETINTGDIWVGEVENRKKSGEPFFTQLLISPIIDSNGAVVGHFGIHRDITEKRNLDRQLIHTQKMESIGTLAAGVAHEVGNPLASISALVQVAQRSTTDEFIIDRLELVKKQVTRISKIIRDLVDFSRPSNYELVLTDLNQNVEEAVEIVKVGKKTKDIIFNVKLDQTIPQLPLVADQLQQVFVNILINAVDAIVDDKNSIIKHNKKISVSTYKNEENIFIEFKDNGMGIPADNLSKIFEPFYTTKKEGKGTGLGLWVSYGIIKSFQGEISVESNEGNETVFLISIPTNP
jgi:PAS domain S-box